MSDGSDSVLHKLVCICDTHLVPRGQMLHGLDPEFRLRACVDDIVRNHSDAFSCVVLGDLAHKADPAAYDLFREIVALLPMPVHLMIGNHDRRSLLRERIPAAPSDGKGFVQSAFDTPAGRFILTDTVEEGTNGGSYCGDRQEWLIRQLELAGDRDIYLFMHHPPFDCGIPCLDRIGQNDKDDIARIIGGDARIKHLFLGHVHRPIAGSWKGIPFSSARATNHQVPFDLRELDHVPKSQEGPQYRVVFIQPDQVVVHWHDYLS